MRITKVILVILLAIMVIPLFSVIILSFQNINGDVLKWYKTISLNESFREAFGLSIIISITSTLLTTILSFIISLSWFNKKQMFIVMVLILITGLLPPDIMALSLSKISQLLGFYGSNLFFLTIGLTLYTLPFGVLLFWSRFYFIQNSIITSAKDIGLKKIFIVTKIILPLSKPIVISCLLLCFLLAFNEYPRTFYLSGSKVLVSEFLNGKLSSGANESIYAGGSITIIITILLISLLALGYLIFRRKKRAFHSTY
jgi:ABC-type spermidine/putrescine transport system permease subunit II